MKIKHSIHDDIIVFSLSGNLVGEPEGSALRDQINAATTKGKRKVILDCTHLDVMNSTGLGIIIATLTSLRKVQGELCLAAVNSHVEGVLTLTQIIKIVRTYDSVERALEGLK